MNIGYACITTGLPYVGLRSCRQENATEEKLRAIIGHNLAVLQRQVEYNIRRGIRLFRISSDLIPFASSAVNRLEWWDEFGDEFARIGGLAAASGMRVSMHPGQYTVLSSPDAGVVERAVEDLRYHARVLDALTAGTASKIVLHVGGAYGNRRAALARFAGHFTALPANVRARLVIENDERCYPIADVLELATHLGIPVVYDNLHNGVYPSDPTKDDAFWVRQAVATWKEGDGRQKIHYSQQDPGKKRGAHAPRIRLPEFLTFVGSLGELAPDIMLEGKDKDLSAVKCQTVLSSVRSISLLEAEWARYKYLVLERDPSAYRKIRELLKEKGAFPATDFYALVDGAMEKAPTTGTFENAALHVWGYFKSRATADEKQAFERKLFRFRMGNLSPAAVKRQLWGLAEQHDEPYLRESLFFADKL